MIFTGPLSTTTVCRSHAVIRASVAPLAHRWRRYPTSDALDAGARLDPRWPDVLRWAHAPAEPKETALSIPAPATLTLTTALLIAADSAQRTPGRATAPDLDPERTSASFLLLFGALGVVLLLALVIVLAVLRRPKE
ncbi:hypothetical protein DV701_05955 [Ornithinimicrobium avium]|uniref:Uncharacterized protein n=1 Tax=Ornithinimicrobium avium TaxID=2283195 RepID=A0A345NL20_9MICO|nr:hypothetical protein DV701_05955 [Ornithinimicrobium avium]